MCGVRVVTPRRERREPTRQRAREGYAEPVVVGGRGEGPTSEMWPKTALIHDSHPSEGREGCGEPL